jgi:hypothetical protein
MAFLFGVVTFLMGAALVAVCLVAIPGPEALEGDPVGHGKNGDPAGHGHGAH